MEPQATPRKRRRWPLRLAIAFGLLVLLAVIAAAALPWFLNSPSGRRWLLARADKALAPGKLEFQSVHLAWFGPTEFTGFALIDRQGDVVAKAPRAHWDRSLWQILFDRPRFGTLALDGAALDVERDRNGAIDLFETIRPVLGKNPKLSLAIQFQEGTIRFRSPGLAEPVFAHRAAFDLRISPAPGAWAWKLQLVNPGGQGAERLEVEGSYERWQESPGGYHDLALAVKAEQWPLAALVAGVTARGRLEGDFTINKKSGQWLTAGDAAVLNFEAFGDHLAGDHLRLDRLSGSWQVEQSEGYWSVRKLDLESAIASLKAEGALPAEAGKSAKIVGRIDLAAIAAQVPHALHLREGLTLERGSVDLRVELAGGEAAEQQRWDVEARVSDLIAKRNDRTITLHEPATLLASLVRERDYVAIEQMGLKTAFLEATARGDFKRGITLDGTIDLGGLERQLHDLVDFGNLSLAGKGKLSGEYRTAGANYEGRLEAGISGLHVAWPALGEFERDRISLGANTSGPASTGGLPAGWSATEVKLDSDGTTANLAAKRLPESKEISLVASASTRLDLALNEAGDEKVVGAPADAPPPPPVPAPREPIAGANDRGNNAPDANGRAQARLEARWGKDLLAIDRLRLEVQPASRGETKPEPIYGEARGKLDFDAGELALESLPAPAGAKPIVQAGSLHLSGLGRGHGALRGEGQFAGDIGVLANTFDSLTGREPAGIEGSWTWNLNAKGGENGVDVGSKLVINNLSWPGRAGQPRHTEAPVTLALRAHSDRDSDRVDLPELVFTSGYATLTASGHVADLGGKRNASLKGKLEPDWKVINKMLAERIEPGAYLEGQPRPFRLEGSLAGSSLGEVVRGLDAEGGFDLVEADCYGMKVGKAPIVVRASEGEIAIDPIATTLNNGRMKLDPQLHINDADQLVLQFGPKTTIENAEVNDDVSRRVLAFVAPVLQDATRAHGLVSAQIRRAEFPIGPGLEKKALVEGDVVFRNVEFVPGPLADELLNVVGIARKPTIQLDQPVTLAIADGRVVQHGLALPIAGLTRIELDGWVDFDRNLSMVASMPITPKLLGNQRLLTDIAAGARISIPIAGTLSNPKIDKDALGAGMKDLGKDLLERTAIFGAGELLDRLTRPRDPNAMPPPRLFPNREERRERQQEKKAERQRRREMRREERERPDEPF